jgi:hypothetical protein
MNYYNYFTEIEEHFVRRRGKHLFVSPLDWSLIATWRDTGVPLHVALRGIDVAMDAFFARKRPEHDRVSTLVYCHSSVMTEYARHLESHLGEESEGEAGEAGKDKGEPARQESAGPNKEAVEQFLAQRIAEIRALLAKQPVAGESAEGIGRIQSRLEEIARDAAGDHRPDLESLERDLGILDEALVLSLRARIPEQQLAEWEKEGRTELKVYRKKLPKDTYERILENYLRSKVRRHFNIGELSLFHL